MPKFFKSKLYASIFICTLSIIITIILSFILKSPTDSIISVLSLSFTIIGSLATVSTLIIALMLYDQFGLKNRFVEHQTNKVIELIDLLKGKVIYCKSDRIEYLIRPSQKFLINVNEYLYYQNDSKKIIVISSGDYQDGIEGLLSLKKSYWMPNSIKSKMEFLDIAGTFDFDDSIENYIKLSFKENSNTDLKIPFNSPTFEYFNKNLLMLIVEIEDWLQTRSGLKIDFKMEESH